MREDFLSVSGTKKEVRKLRFKIKKRQGGSWKREVAGAALGRLIEINNTKEKHRWRQQKSEEPNCGHRGGRGSSQWKNSGPKRSFLTKTSTKTNPLGGNRGGGKCRWGRIEEQKNASGWTLPVAES